MQARYYAIALKQYLDENPKAEISSAIAHLKDVLARRGHTALLPRVVSEFEKEMVRDQRAKGVVLTVANEKDSAHALKESSKITSEKDIRVDIDPGLLGGFSLRGPGFRYDNSVKTTLRELYKSLTTAN